MSLREARASLERARRSSGLCTALLSLLPHPSEPDDGLALILAASSHAGSLERGVRALQQALRTGAQLPEWVVLGGAQREWMGAGGLLGAGCVLAAHAASGALLTLVPPRRSSSWYDADWRWSHTMSWLS